jgi:uncharacterized protein YdeI (YjbR/CyaY-like superfamily)
MVDEFISQHNSFSNLLTKPFNALTLIKKREFSDYISNAKRVETKVKQIEKITPMILNS